MIQGYPDETSVFPGETIEFHVSTDAPQFRIDFYRQGATLDLKLSSDWLPGVFADVHDSWQDWGVAATRSDGTQVDAWPPYPLTIPGDWQTGVYIAMFVEGDGRGNPNANQQPPLDANTSDARKGKTLFVVKNPSPGIASQVLYKLPLFTYQSYNDEGASPNDAGNSIYGSVDVSLHRPGGGTGGTPWDAWNYDPFDQTPRQVFVHWDAKLIAWLEGNGYRIDYCTDWDLHNEDGLALLAPYAVVLSVGHDEYYSTTMRDNLEAFLAAGGNIAFLSGNTSWWRTEFSDIDPFRMLGQQTIHHWSDPQIGRSEDSLTGVSWGNGGEQNKDRSKQNGTQIGYIVQHVDQWPFEGTGLAENDVIGGDDGLVGYECDGAPYDKGSPRPVSPKPDPLHPTPDGFLILGTADLAAFEVRNGNYAATMGMYTRSGTAFTAATTDWPRVVAAGDARVAGVTRNVLDRLGGNPKGLAQLRNVANIICCDGFFSADDNFRHAIVGTGDGNITEIRFSPEIGQPQGITAFLNGLLDFGGFTSDNDQVRHVVAVDFQGNVWDIFWDANNQPLSQILVNTPNAIRVAGFYTADDQLCHAIVGTSDGQVIEVYYQSLGNGNPQTAPLGSFDGLVDVGGFFSPDDGYRHAMVGAAGGAVTEIFYNPDFGIFQTQVATIPDLARVSGYYAGGDQFYNRRVQVLTNGGRVHEVRYKPDFGIMRAVLYNPGTLVDLGGFYTADDDYRHSIFATPDGDVQELFFKP